MLNLNKLWDIINDKQSKHFEVRTLDKYEYRVKTEQMLEHMEHKRYKKAMEIADTIDWKRVKNPSILNSVRNVTGNFS